MLEAPTVKVVSFDDDLPQPTNNSDTATILVKPAIHFFLHNKIPPFLILTLVNSLNEQVSNKLTNEHYQNDDDSSNKCHRIVISLETI